MMCWTAAEERGCDQQYVFITARTDDETETKRDAKEKVEEKQVGVYQRVWTDLEDFMLED